MVASDGDGLLRSGFDRLAGDALWRRAEETRCAGCGVQIGRSRRSLSFRTMMRNKCEGSVVDIVNRAERSPMREGVWKDGKRGAVSAISAYLITCCVHMTQEDGPE